MALRAQLLQSSALGQFPRCDSASRCRACRGKGVIAWRGPSLLYGLTLNSGIYGSTFFMLTGFHGFHVAMGMTMLLIQLVRSLRREHFTATDHFGFEASSWYWHFVDVVWVFLFLFVYIL